MKKRLLALVVFLLILAPALVNNAGAEPSPGQEKKKKGKSPLPGPATWDVKALDKLFRVVETKYDKEARKAKWTLELRAATRRFDFVREIDRDKPFVFVFTDKENDELATVRVDSRDFKGIPEGKVIKDGTRLELTLKVPDVLAKANKVVLQRGVKD
jgi:hypothetical protein